MINYAKSLKPKRPNTMPITWIYKVLENSNKFTFLLQGSMRSGKTTSIFQRQILRCATNTGLISRHFRRDATTAKKTLVEPVLFKILKTQLPELWNEKCWNEQKACYTLPTNYPNNSKIYIDGTNDIEKLNGQEQDDAHINEVIEVSLPARNAIAGRTKYYKYMDWNPYSTAHWVFEVELKQDPSLYEFIQSTYKDNPYLTSIQVAEIEKWEPTPYNIKHGTANKWQWEVFGLGIPARRPGTIYTNWDITPHWPNPMNCIRHGYGLDFGFSQFNTALIECAFFQNQLWLRERVYERELTNLQNPHDSEIPSLEGRMNEVGIPKRGSRIIGDSSRADLIRELRNAGWNVNKVAKTKGVSGKPHLLASIIRMQQYFINVHINSVNLQTELQNYCWMVDPKTEKILDVPIDDFNDALDAARMWVWMNSKPRHDDSTQKQRRLAEQTNDPYNHLKKSMRSNARSSNAPLWNQSLQESIR